MVLFPQPVNAGSGGGCNVSIVVVIYMRFVIVGVYGMF